MEIQQNVYTHAHTYTQRRVYTHLHKQTHTRNKKKGKRTVAKKNLIITIFLPLFPCFYRLLLSLFLSVLDFHLAATGYIAAVAVAAAVAAAAATILRQVY